MLHQSLGAPNTSLECSFQLKLSLVHSIKSTRIQTQDIILLLLLFAATSTRVERSFFRYTLYYIDRDTRALERLR